MPRVELPTPTLFWSIGLYKPPAREEVSAGLLAIAKIPRDLQSHLVQLPD